MAETIASFAETLAKIVKTDRWLFIGCDGEMGEGKSCLTAQLAEEIARKTGTPFSLQDNMTYRRSELKEWIDGDKDGKNKKPECSAILADEIISMFFKRNWFDTEQIDGVELLNKCRDRHLIVIGNIPNFWDLDSAIYPLMSLWIHVHERGTAWVFIKDRNPFATDKWHRKENEKRFLKAKGPYRCKGFLCEINYPDWTPAAKDEYYRIRNVKRLNTEGQRKKEERYHDIKVQRDELIRFVFKLDDKLTPKDVSGIVPSLTPEAIRLIKLHER